jgi:hypothetical protein
MAEPAAGEVMRSSVESSRAVAVSQFHRGVVTTDALKVGVAADRDNRHQSYSAFLAVRDLTHGNPPELFIHNPFRALPPNGHLISPRSTAHLRQRVDGNESTFPRLSSVPSALPALTDTIHYGLHFACQLEHRKPKTDPEVA